MNVYSEVDVVIARWVETVGSTLFTEWGDGPARFFHVPGYAPYECFQITIAPPSEGRLSVVARAIDTNDDTEAEMERSWNGSVHELDAMLASAIDAVEHWIQRNGSQVQIS